MKYITFALALLGVVGSIKLDQVPTLPMSTFAQINEQAGDPGRAVADAIEASKDKSVDREQLGEVLSKYFGDKKTKNEIERMVEWVFSKTDALGDKDGRITREELEKLTSKENNGDDHHDRDNKDNGNELLMWLHKALEHDSDKKLTRTEAEDVMRKFAKEHGMPVNEEQVKGFVNELFSVCGVADGGSLTKEHLERLNGGNDHGDKDHHHHDGDHHHHDDGPNDEQKKEIAQALRAALEASKSGTLTLEDTFKTLMAYVKSKGLKVPEHEIKSVTKDIFGHLDENKDGKVNKEELEKAAAQLEK